MVSNALNSLDDVTPEILEEILSGHLASPKETFKGFMILINGKVWICDGQFLFGSKEAAWKAFYNSCRWRVARCIKPDVPGHYKVTITRKQFKDFRERCITYKEI